MQRYGSQIGWVIVCGIAFGTLFVVPTAYTLRAGARHPAEHAPPAGRRRDSPGTPSRGASVRR